MNNLKSYTEYAVTTPTTDFVIGFDFNYGTDAVNVTVGGVPATEAGYSVIYLNSTTMRLSPAVPSGVVRLQRETDIDVPDNQFTAGAKFIASNMDENFTQIRHAQQEVRDGFSKLSDDTYAIIDTLQEVGPVVQAAAEAAEQAAIVANDAAAQVYDKVSQSQLDYIHENGASLPYKDGIDYEENAVVVKDGVLQQMKDGEWGVIATLDGADELNIAINAVGLSRNYILDMTENEDALDANHTQRAVDDLQVVVKELNGDFAESEKYNNLMDAWRSKSAEEIVKSSGASGILNVRNYNNDTGFDATHRPFDTSYATLSMHSHQNYFNTLGMGEFSAVLNGLYVRTTHNDPFLTYSVSGSASVDGSAGAATKEIDYIGAALPPELPSAIASRPTGVVFNDTTTTYGFTELYETVEGQPTQVEYFRNLFNSQTYLNDCRWDLLYLEVYVEELGANGSVVSSVSSPRHFSQGSTLRETIYRNAMTSDSGLKSTLENDSFQKGIIEYVNEDGTPAKACVTYRLRVKSVGKPTIAPTLFSETNKPPLLVIGEAVGLLGTHPHKLDGKNYTIGGVSYTALQLTVSQANTIVQGTPVTIRTSLDQNHAHDIEVSYANGVWKAEDINVVEISGKTVKGHTHAVQVISQSDSIPFDLYKAVNGIIDNTNKFKLVKDTNQRDQLGEDASWKDLAESNKARFVLGENLLETLCERCFGLDGEGSYSTETFHLPGTTAYTVLSPFDSSLINVSKYNRRYAIGGLDASNRGTSPRGFNDPTLFVAKDNTGKSKTGYSYMIPIELILRTPYENWNPYGIPVYKAKEPNKSDAAYFSAQKTAPNLRASYFGGYYVSPIGTFGKNQTSSDGADTGGTNVWMVSNTGQVVKVESTGISITKIANKTEGSAVYKDSVGGDYSNVLRFRYPVYPVFFEQSYPAIKTKSYNKQLKNLLQKIISGTATLSDVNETIGDF